MAAVDFVCGLDLGQVSDPTALCVAERGKVDKDGKTVSHYAVRHLQRWLGVSYPDIAEQLRELFAKLPSKPFLVVDATGVGRAVVDILRTANLPTRRLIPVTITGGKDVTTADSGGYNVPKKELVSVAQSALQSARLTIAARLKEADTLRRELQNFKVKINIASAAESFEAWRSGDHDDLVLSACLSVWHGEHLDNNIVRVVTFAPGRPEPPKPGQTVEIVWPSDRKEEW